MTEEIFRATPDMRTRLDEILSDPVMQQAIAILKEGTAIGDAPLAAPEVASVRILSQRVGAESVITTLLRLTMPLPADPDLGEATFQSETET